MSTTKTITQSLPGVPSVSGAADAVGSPAVSSPTPAPPLPASSVSSVLHADAVEPRPPLAYGSEAPPAASHESRPSALLDVRVGTKRPRDEGEGGGERSPKRARGVRSKVLPLPRVSGVGRVLRAGLLGFWSMVQTVLRPMLRAKDPPEGALGPEPGSAVAELPATNKPTDSAHLLLVSERSSNGDQRDTD